MVPNLSRIAAVSCLLLLLAMSSLEGKELEDRKWIEVSTANFRVRSTLSEKKTIKLIRNLDLLRLAVPAFTNIRRTDSTIPTHIFVVKGAADFDTFGIDRNYVGQFRPGLRNNTILIRATRDMDEASIILHEYVHFLIRNHGGFAYPRWYDEGFSEYLSGTKLSRSLFNIGRAPKHRVNGLLYGDWLTPRQLLDPGEYANLDVFEQSMFYAQSWVLVHFLLNREGRESKFPDDMKTYADQVSSGTDVTEAFENAFGISAGDFTEKLKKYLKSECCKYYRFEIEELQPDFTPEVRRMTRAEISLGLAQAALEWGKYDVARRWYEIAAQAQETRPWAEAGLGDLLHIEDDFAAAQTHLETAVSLAPDDAHVQLDLAEFWLERAASTAFPSEQEAYLKRARRGFVEAWKLDATMPETYVMYGQSFLMEGTRHDKAIEMFEEAQGLHPSNVEIRLMLAEAYARADRKDEAIEAAQLVLSWGHGDGGPAVFARSIIARLEGDAAMEQDPPESSEP
jgi:tetratricopeptide (TPR) repeat protein